MAKDDGTEPTRTLEATASSSSKVSSVTFRSRSLHSVVVVPLLTKDTVESHSSRSLQGFLQALRHHPYSCNKDNKNETEITWVVPNSALTRPGDWKYDATPFKAFHWQYGAQRMRIVEERRKEGEALENATPKKQHAFRDLHPHLRTAAVLGVLNVHDCLKEGGSTSVEELVQRACTELQQWVQHHATSSYGKDSASSPDVPVTRLLVFDSFDVEGGMDLLTQSGGLVDRSSIIAFPPTTNWDDPTLTLHLNWVLSDVLVAIFRDLERKVQPFVSRTEATDTTSTSTGLTRRSLARLISSTASSVSDDEVPPALPTALVPPRPQDAATEGSVTPTTTATPPATSSLTALPKALSLMTPLDEESPPFSLESATPKDLEGLRKREQGRREKWMGDLALLVGSPMDAYERYLKAIELCKPIGVSTGMDPLWYAAALEGCAAAHLAMADVGGYGVDEYLENHFQLPEEIMALARDDAATRKSGHKQTLPEVVFALCEEALQILSRHEKLGNLYAELLLQLAHYCAEEAEGHLRCRWGEGPFGYAGESGEVPRWEKTSVSQMKFNPLKTKEGGHSMIAINTYNRIKKLCELLNAAVAIGTLDAPTRMDVALRSAQICLVGVKPTHWKGPVPDRVQLHRKAAYFTVVAADTWSSMSTVQRESAAQNLWLLATRLYTRNPNPMDGSGGNYGWATLRAFCLDGLSHQGTTDLSLEASDQLLSLLGKLEPDHTTRVEEQKEDEPPVVAMDDSNREPDAVSKDAPRAAVNVDDSDVQDALSSANQFAKNLRTSYNSLTVGSSLLAQQAKWAGEAPISTIEVPLSQSSSLSSVLIALKAVWPNMSLSIASVAQKQCLDRALVLRRAIPTSSFHIDTAAFYGLFEKELPLFVSSDVTVVPEPALELECIKKRIRTGAETDGAGMETFFNPYAKKSVEDGPIARIAEGEERILIVTFGNRLSLPLQIQRGEVIFDQPSSVQTTQRSFAIPPKASSFAVRFPFRVVSDGSDSAASKSEDACVLFVKGVQLTCLGREFFLPIQPVTKPIVQGASAESATKHAPKAPEKKGKKAVNPRVESYPCQPKLEIVYADTLEAIPDVVSISLADGEVGTLPTWRLQNSFGRSKIGQVETLELVLVGTSNRKLFDSSIESQKEESEDRFIEDVMFGLSPPPFKVRALSSGLNLNDINSENGGTLNIQIAAAYNMRKKLPNGCTFEVHVRYRGASLSKSEVWRKRVISFRLASTPGPRVASISFRPDLAIERAFYDDMCKQWTQSAEIVSSEMVESGATAMDSQAILTSLGQHPTVDVCGSKSFFTLTVSNETRVMLHITRKSANITMERFPWSEMIVNAGVSAKIPMELPRIERIDENGVAQDVWGEFAHQTALRWESDDDNALGRKRQGYIRISPAHWEDVIGRYPAVVFQICTPPCSIMLEVNGKSVSDAAISAPLGYPVSVTMKLIFSPWVPMDLFASLLVAMEFQCKRGDVGGLINSSPTNCDFVGAGQWERTVCGGDKEKEDRWDHEMKIAFCAIGQFFVSASVRISRGHESAPEIWWAPMSQAIKVQETNLVAQ